MWCSNSGKTNPNRHPPHLYHVGDKVFDMASQTIQTILDVHIDPQLDGVWQDYFDQDADGDSICLVCYTVSGAPDPTGDGAFPDGGRCYFEVADPDETIELNY